MTRGYKLRFSDRTAIKSREVAAETSVNYFDEGTARYHSSCAFSALLGIITDLSVMESNFFLQRATRVMAWIMGVWVVTVTTLVVVAAGPIRIPMNMCIPEGSYVSTELL